MSGSVFLTEPFVLENVKPYFSNTVMRMKRNVFSYIS